MKTLKIAVMVALLSVFFGAVSAYGQSCRPDSLNNEADLNFDSEVNYHLINYQGKLVDYQGNLVHDTLAMTFSIYNVPTGGIPLWTETQPEVIIWGGVYNVLLGSVNPLPDYIFTEAKDFTFDKWLGVQIELHSEMKPRQRIAMTAHSINSDMLDGNHLTKIMNDVLYLIETNDWGRVLRKSKWHLPQDIANTDSLWEGICNPRPLVNIYVNEEGPDTMEFNGSTPTFQVKNEGSGDAVKGMAAGSGIAILGESVSGYGGKFTSSSDTALYAGSNVAAAYLDGNVKVTGVTHLNNSTESGGTTSGALYVDGGVGIAKKLNVGGITAVADNTQSTTKDNGALVVQNGGAGIEGDLNIGGNMGIGTYAANTALNISATDEYLINAKQSSTDRFSVKNSGQTTISSSVSGSDGSRDSYALRLDSGSQGMWIKLTGASWPNSSNNYITFSGSDLGRRGRIEGQNNTDMLSDWVYWFDNVVTIKDIACATADVVGASTSSTPCVGLGACVTTPVPSLIVAASVILGLEVANAAIFQAEIWTKVGVSYESGSGDYAEWLERLDEREDIAPGDIVGVFGGRVSKCTKGAEQILCVSTAPIVIGNMPEEGKENLCEKVAFMGQVPVKVVGPVEKGDFIIPSGQEDGTGIAISPEFMTADEYAKMIGRAWSSSLSHSAKLINVAIGLNSGDIAHFVQKHQEENRILRTQVEILKSEVSELKGLNSKLEQIETALEKITGTPLEENLIQGIETTQKSDDE